VVGRRVTPGTTGAKWTAGNRTAGNACIEQTMRTDSHWCQMMASHGRLVGRILPTLFPPDKDGILLMTTVARISPWLSCVALCALAGCCTTQKQTACANCQTSAVCSVPSTYENYTPPSPNPLPAPMPPAEDELPPPPASRNAPNNQFDFFDSAKRPMNSLTR
jgi:hypothetical protein